MAYCFKSRLPSSSLMAVDDAGSNDYPGQCSCTDTPAKVAR